MLFRFEEEDFSMTSSKAVAALLALAGTISPTLGQAADDVASLRAELQALKSEYTTRVDALKARIAQLESAPVGALAEQAPPPQPMAMPAQGGAAPGTAFNPAISLILAGSYTDVSQ